MSRLVRVDDEESPGQPHTGKVGDEGKRRDGPRQRARRQARSAHHVLLVRSGDQRPCPRTAHSCKLWASGSSHPWSDRPYRGCMQRDGSSGHASKSRPVGHPAGASPAVASLGRVSADPQCNRPLYRDRSERSRRADRAVRAGRCAAPRPDGSDSPTGDRRAGRRPGGAAGGAAQPADRALATCRRRRRPAGTRRDRRRSRRHQPARLRTTRRQRERGQQHRRPEGERSGEPAAVPAPRGGHGVPSRSERVGRHRGATQRRLRGRRPRLRVRRRHPRATSSRRCTSSKAQRRSRSPSPTARRRLPPSSRPIPRTTSPC